MNREVGRIDAHLEDLDAGGKALGLARLMAAGQPVPEAFVVTARAFSRHRSSLPTSGRELAAVDPGLAADLVAAWSSLGAGPVAVRSSGLLEDGRGGSQAGMYPSFLNLVSAEALLDAVIGIWRRVEELGANETLAIVVQRQLDPVAAGVMLTASPQAAGRVLIESAWGLGITVAAGGPADRLLIDAANGRMEVHLAAKARTLRLAPGGGTKSVSTPHKRVHACSLSQTQALSLAERGKLLEAAWGGPQDVEWALLADGALWLVQARPALAADDWDAPPPERPFDLWSRAYLVDLLPDPVSPFTWSLAAVHWSRLRRSFYRPFRLPGLAQVRFFRLWDQRLYFNVGASYHLRARLGLGHEALAPHLVSTEAPARHGTSHRSLNMRLLVRNLPGWLLAQMMSAWVRRRCRARFEACARIAERLRASEIDGAAPAEVWARFRRLWTDITRLELIQSSVDDAAFAAGRFLEIACHRWLGGLELFPDLVTGPSGGPAAEIASEITALAASAPLAVRRTLRRKGFVELGGIAQASPEWHLELEAFLRRHGHRSRGELDLAQPRWVEDPTPVLDAIRPQLGVGPSRRPPAVPASVPAVKLALQRLKELPGERFVPWRRLVFLAVLARTRHLVPLRSIPRDRVMLLYLEARRALLELGRRLAEKEILNHPEDVFMLTEDEVEELVGGSSRSDVMQVVRRRRQRRQAAATRPAPEQVTTDGRPKPDPAQAWPAGDPMVSGLGAVPGTVRGRVRILRRPEDAASIQPGEVLVMAATDIGSTLLFPLAAALVVEEGGLLSHASVLAREYGLPTVVQALGAGQRLSEGALVEVDGALGVVSLVEASETPT
jgi:pyruvate,water dikinase